ncbi:MAG: hypothetical protein ABIU87_00690 [Ornithinibacter sp.]
MVVFWIAALRPEGAEQGRVREIRLVRLDKLRPALVLTRQAARGAMTEVTVAPITSTIKGSSEVLVGPDTGWTMTARHPWTTSSPSLWAHSDAP